NSAASPPKDQVVRLRPAGCYQEGCVRLDRRAGSLTEWVGDDRLQHPRTQQVVIEHQDRILKGAVGVGLDVGRQGRAQGRTTPVEQDDRRIGREAGADDARYEAGGADRRVECDRRLEARDFVGRVGLALPEIGGTDRVDALAPTAHLYVDVEETENVCRLLE